MYPWLSIGYSSIRDESLDWITSRCIEPSRRVETDELLGAHIVGEQGAEIVHELVVAIELGATAEDVANTMHIRPTLPESITSAAGGVHEPS